MLKLTPRRTSALATAGMTIGALIAATTPAAAASGWQLVDQSTARPACSTPAGAALDLEIDLNGTWSTSIAVGASNLPAGVTSSGSLLITFTNGVVSAETAGAPIPPGWSNGTGPVGVSTPNTFVEGYAEVTVPSGLAVNSSFDITLWANDGSTLQTETVPIDIKTSCIHY
ncbi:MAG TPA: hypothetical protein VGM10_07340 [Actinocrinis sp.]|jgi:hypothetical protein